MHFSRITDFIQCSLLVLLLMPGRAFATSIADLSLVYHVSFDDGSLMPEIDTVGIGALKLGHSQVSGSMPIWVLENGGLTLGITQPAGPLANVSAGAHATPVAFGTGSIFGMRAVFVAPVGPHEASNVWAVALGARTGDEDDFAAETRAAATFQTRGTVARVNAVGATVPAAAQNLPQGVQDAIYDAIAPSAFTLELIVDRVTGTGYQALYLGQDIVFSRSFDYAVFTATGGPTITSIGPALVIADAPGQSASVRLLDFQVFASPAAIPEPSTLVLLSSGVLLGAIARLRAHRASVRKHFPFSRGGISPRLPRL